MEAVGSRSTMEMYKVKPYYEQNLSVSTPKVMYKLGNLHKTDNQTENGCQGNDPISVLERRQENILQRLTELKSMVENLGRKYNYDVNNVNQDVGDSVSTAQTPDLGDVVLDIVISADPQYPPVSLFVLYQLLRQKYKVKGTCHVHSSVNSVPDNLTNVFQSDGRSADNRSNYQVIITLIWKKVENGPTLMVSPHNQVPIQGEVNIARYLTRLLDLSYQTGSIAWATQVDEWLDMVQRQFVSGNSKERAAVIKSLNVRLGSNNWLVGSSTSVADIVAWSVLFQYKMAADVPGNVKKWLLACNQQEMFKKVQPILA